MATDPTPGHGHVIRVRAARVAQVVHTDHTDQAAPEVRDDPAPRVDRPRVNDAWKRRGFGGP